MAEAKGTQDIVQADAIFSALAHPARRQVLLSVHYRGTCNAGEIANRFDCAWPTMSRHLRTLVDADLLRVSKSGRERMYSANNTLLAKLLRQWADYFD